MIGRMLIAGALTLAGAFPAVAEIEIEEVTSPGGLTAWLVEDHSLPFVAIEMRFLGGTSLDRPGKDGAVNLMTATLEEGADGRDAQEFATAREGLAARFEYDAYRDAVTVSAQMLTETRDEAVALLSSSLVSPSFDEDAVDRVRGQVLSILASEATEPGEIAARAFDAASFPDHPYGDPSDGTVQSVGALTREDVVQAHRDVLVRDRVFIAAAGDVTAEELGTLLDDLLGDLPMGGAELPGAAEFAADAGIEVVDLDTPQSVILFGHEGIPQDDPDFIPAYILNQIFGGRGFDSRLMQQVRVERGLTYGIGTWLGSRQFGERVMGQSSTANPRVGEAVEVIQDEWARIAEGVTEAELEQAKTYLTGAYPLRFDGNATIAGILVSMQMQGMPIDYVVTRNDQVEAVTLDEITRVAERLFRPEDLRFVIVGRPEGVATEG